MISEKLEHYNGSQDLDEKTRPWKRDEAIDNI
jgi:hypothetical protein